jgi:betaine lipid synthase
MLGLSTIIPRDPFNLVVLSLAVIGIFLLTVFAFALQQPKKGESSTLQAYLKFFYACFVKPHTGDGSGSQQDALVCSVFLKICYFKMY